MLTPAPPPHVLPLLLEVAHAPRLPATAANDASLNMWLTLNLRLPFYIWPHISYLTAPLFQFSVIIYLRTTRFITYFGL